MTIEGPPPPEEGERLAPGGPGVARAAGRGMPVAPMGGERLTFSSYLLIVAPYDVTPCAPNSKIIRSPS